jgi:dihydropteroate synthase
MPFAMRARTLWRLRNRSLEVGRRTVVMGILNITPDSFSDGGAWLDQTAALGHALAMLDAGADIVDVGGESTRPNAVELTPAEEQARVIPVVQALLRARPEAVVSIDTYHAETARIAVAIGAEIVNDVSGGLWDPGMSAACAESGCGTVLMHTRGRPQEWGSLPALEREEVMPLVLGELAARAEAAMAVGMAREAIVLDPGFGFGKGHGGDWQMLAEFTEFGRLGFPLLAGVSRKGFLRAAPAKAGFTQEGSAGKAGWSRAVAEATNAAQVAAILSGAHVLRVHDVEAARTAAAVADKILATAEGS